MKKILFLFLSITISSFAQIKDAYYYNNAVYDSIWEKDPRLSIEYLTKAIELDSNDAVFYYNRSKAWNKLGYRINSLNATTLLKNAEILLSSTIFTCLYAAA